MKFVLLTIEEIKLILKKKVCTCIEENIIPDRHFFVKTLKEMIK